MKNQIRKSREIHFKDFLRKKFSRLAWRYFYFSECVCVCTERQEVSSCFQSRSSQIGPEGGFLYGRIRKLNLACTPHPPPVSYLLLLQNPFRLPTLTRAFFLGTLRRSTLRSSYLGFLGLGVPYFVCHTALRGCLLWAVNLTCFFCNFLFFCELIRCSSVRVLPRLELFCDFSLCEQKLLLSDYLFDFII